MPVYDYECESCGSMEIEHSIKEPARTICPKCQREGLQRTIGRTSFTLRGGGWANQGYSSSHSSPKRSKS